MMGFERRAWRPTQALLQAARRGARFLCETVPRTCCGLSGGARQIVEIGRCLAAARKSFHDEQPAVCARRRVGFPTNPQLKSEGLSVTISAILLRSGA